MAVFTFLNVWWVTLFMVLPWGVRRPQHIEPGHAASAPESVNFKKKFFITTVLAAVFTALIALAIHSGMVQLKPE